MTIQKFKRAALIFFLLAFPWLVAFQTGDGENVTFTEGQLALLVNFLLPVIAQVVKVYREKIGKKPAAAVINWAIFLGGAVMAFFWGGAADYFGGFDLPTFDAADPAGLFAAIWAFVNAVFFAGGKVLGVAVGYYLLLKPLVFRFIPWFQTEGIKKANAARG